jgi:Uncharacterised nucleotidyltransferase
MHRALRPEEELVLLVAGTRERRAAPRVGQLDWTALLADLEYQGLVPLLGGRIVEAAGSAAPPEFARSVSKATGASQDAGALLELTTLRIATALEEAGVANVPLKGPLLARALHGDPGMRDSRDIDVLLAREDLGRAADALGPLGWRPKAEQSIDPVLHVALVHEAGLPDIELHWRVHWYEAEFGAEALRRAEPGPDGVRRLRRVDDLAALMLYQARDGFAGLRHPTDIAAWWDAHGDEFDTPVVEPTARAYPGLRRALTASAVLLERLVGVPAARLIEPPARLPWGAARAIALANPLMRGSPHQVLAEVSLVDGLLSPRGQRIAFLRRRALPSTHDLPSSSASRHVALARAEHALRIVRRYALAVLRSRPRAK